VKVTNRAWVIDGALLKEELKVEDVFLLNDVAATALAVPHLTGAEVTTLRRGVPDKTGAVAVVAPGTGLGEAFLTWDGGGWQVHATEGGHAHFAPTSRLEMRLLAHLQERLEHVGCEALCSGPGIERIYRFLRGRGLEEEPLWLAEELLRTHDPVPLIVEAALSRGVPLCVRTLRIFASVLGAEAGNFALKTLATGGVYLGGGIVPRIIPLLDEEAFFLAFNRRGPLTDLLEGIPLHVIMEPRAALLGAAAMGWKKLAPLDLSQTIPPSGGVLKG
jgi:glucokinase